MRPGRSLSILRTAPRGCHSSNPLLLSCNACRLNRHWCAVGDVSLNNQSFFPPAFIMGGMACRLLPLANLLLGEGSKRQRSPHAFVMLCLIRLYIPTLLKNKCSIWKCPKAHLAPSPMMMASAALVRPDCARGGGPASTGWLAARRSFSKNDSFLTGLAV